MLTKLEIKIEKNEEINLNTMSLFQGVLMERIDREYGDFLHISNLKPYTQSLSIENDCVIWKITTLYDEAKEKIIDVLNTDDFNEIELKYKKLKLKILDKKLTQISEQELMEKYYFGESKRFVKINFTTPTSFKSDGKYQIYPNLRWIYQSIMIKHDEASNESVAFNEDVLEDLVNYSEITSYNLRSTNFQLEGVKVPSFIGRITIKVKGPQMMVNLVNFMIAYAEFSGVGIKTSVGMGSIKFENGGI